MDAESFIVSVKTYDIYKDIAEVLKQDLILQVMS